MNNVFNFKRFCKYFKYDLISAGNNYGVNLIVLGLSPVILYVLLVLFGLVFPGVVNADNVALHATLMFFTVFALQLTYPVRVYGGLTDRRQGSSWLMIPASALEKWLSIILVTCLVLPVVFYTVFLGSDQILSWIFPESYGQSWIAGICHVRGKMADAGVSLNAGFVFVLLGSWLFNFLFFVIGAMVFRKAKAAKTLLVVFVLSAVLSIFLQKIGFVNDGLLMTDFGPGPEAIRYFSVRISAYVAILDVLVAAGLWFRIKTLRH